MKVLLVEIPPQIVKFIQLALKQIDKEVITLTTTIDGLADALYFQTYKLVFFLDQSYPKFIPIITKFPMEKRREMIFVLFVERGRSLDPLQAFIKHVDAVINIEELSGLGQYIESILENHQRLYRGFFQVYQAVEEMK